VRPSTLGAAARLGAALCGALIAAAAWSLYQEPAMGLMLAALRFCG
jgi:hypothetical protein